MWPILASFFLSLCVLLDRVIWWLQYRRKLRPASQDQARHALGTGDFSNLWKLVNQSSDPYLVNLRDGMTHAHTSMLAAMQLHATHLIEKSEARMWVLSTMITLAPLLGLFGTVVGMIQMFLTILSTGVGDANQLAGGIGQDNAGTATAAVYADNEWRRVERSGTHERFP